MLSSRLIAMVEDHWESIAARVIQQIRQDPELFHLRKMPESELRDMGREISKNLGHWLTASEREVARRYEQIGRLRYQQLVPLHESVHALHIVKQAMLSFVRDQGLGQTTVEVYAEEELEHHVGLFFDCVVHCLVRGYEDEMRQALHQTVASGR
jgi:hypothetical protein